MLIETMPACASRASSRTGPAARHLAALVCWLGLSVLPGQAMTATADAAKATALQACPAIEEEVVDLQLLADGLRNSSAVSMLEKLRLRSAIDDLIGRMKAYHDGARTFSLAQLQQQYDLLLMCIAAHLQHKDQLLHGQLCNAWEPIWRDLVGSGTFYNSIK